MNTLRTMRGHPPAVQLLLINQLGVNTGFYLLIPYLATHLDEDLGMSAAVVGIVLGVRNLSQQGLFIVGGSAADRLGARGVIIAGCALRTVGFAFFALGDGLAVLLAASVLSGVAGALFNPAVRAYIAVESGERKAEAFALFNVFATTGALIGPLLGSALLLVDFRASALTAAAVFAALTVAQAAVLPAREVPKAQHRLVDDWREVLANRRFLAFSLAMVGMFTLENQLYLLLPAGAREATGLPGAAGAVFVVGTVANLALQLRITARLKERGDRGRWVSLGLAVMGLAFVPPLLVTVGDGGGSGTGWAEAALLLTPVLAGAFLLYAGIMVAQPFVMELIPEFGSKRLTGTYFGVFYVVSGIAAAVGNTAVGWAMDAGDRGDRAWLPWLCCLTFGLLSAAAVGLLRRLRALPEPGGVPRDPSVSEPGDGPREPSASEPGPDATAASSREAVS
ncbi:MFS transporter [Streptomyces sp. NPDC048639]|uniref:MFS transporter n=1 Tax=Streptomyces sp. NPDC048639 TaxID=3365581 RepID=UPI00371A8FB7